MINSIKPTYGNNLRKLKLQNVEQIMKKNFYLGSFFSFKRAMDIFFTLVKDFFSVKLKYHT